MYLRTYVCTCVRTYVTSLRTYKRTYVNPQVIYPKRSQTYARAHLRIFWVPGVRTPRKLVSRKPRHDTKSSNAVEDGAKTPPGPPLRAPGRTVISPGTLPRRLHRCLGNLRTYVHVKNRPRPPSRRPPGRPRSPKSLLIGPDEIKTVQTSPQHAPKAGLVSMSGRF